MKKADYWIIQPNSCHFLNGEPEYPAPSMAEVWRELPIGSLITKCRNGEITHLSGFGEYSIANTNPTDALIDLLIWLIWARKEKL